MSSLTFSTFFQDDIIKHTVPLKEANVISFELKKKVCWEDFILVVIYHCHDRIAHVYF